MIIIPITVWALLPTPPAGPVVSVLHYRELLNFCARALKDRDAAADVVQEAYARLLASARPGETVQDSRALLFRIVRNLMVDQHRREQTRPEQAIEGLPEYDEPRAPQALQPEERYALTQYLLALLKTIEALPPRCREVFILNRFDGLSHQEIADQLGISRNMVAQHVIRAVLACKQCHRRFHGESFEAARGGKA